MKKRLYSAFLALAMVLALLPVPVSAANEGVWNGGVYEWYYAQLDGTQQRMYEFLKETLVGKETTNSWEVQCTLSDEMRKVDNQDFEGWAVNFYTAYHALERDHPERPWLSTDIYSLRNEAEDSVDATGEQLTREGWNPGTRFCLSRAVVEAWGYAGQFEEAADRAVTAIGTQSSDYEQAKAIHDYLCGLVKYGSDMTPYAPADETAFYALSGTRVPDAAEPNYNTATSEGYAAAFKLLCDRFGIPCVRVSGSLGKKADEEARGWNLVQLDGQWYGVDCEADDLGDSASSEFFAVGSSSQVKGSAFSENRDIVNRWQRDCSSFGLEISLPQVPSMSPTAYGEPPIEAADTETTLASVDPVTYGDRITLTAHVTSGGDPVTSGSVIFSRQADGEAQGLGEGPVKNGTATFTLEGKYPVGSYSFTAAFAPDGTGYEESTSTAVTLQVQPKTVEITGLKAEDRPYDCTQEVTLTGGKLAGVVDGDDVTVDLPATGTISSANASAEPYEVTVEQPVLKGADAGNYTLEKVSGITVTIGKAGPKVGAVSAKGTVYDTTVPEDVELQREGEGLTPGTIVLDKPVTWKVGAGSYPWTFTPTDGTNYQTAQGKVDINVQARKLEGITVSGTPGKVQYVYGESFDPTGLTITAAYTNGDTAVIPVDDARVAYSKLGDAGEAAQTVTVTFQGKTAKVEGITVKPKPLSTAGISWDTAGSPFTYNKTEQGVTVTGEVPDELNMTVTGARGTNAGTYTAKAAFTLKTGLKAGNYDLTAVADKTAEWKISQAAVKAQDVGRSMKPGNTKVQTVSAAEFGIGQAGAFALKSGGAVADEGKVLAADYPACGVSVRFALAQGAAAGKTVTIPLTFTPTDRNYAPVDVTLTITLTDKDIPVLTASGLTKVYDGAAVKVDGIKKTASAAGTWAFKDGAGPVDVAQSGVYTLVFTPADGEKYVAAEINVAITITKATPTGKPRYDAITAGGKTLADAHLSAEGFTPSGGTVRWVDRAGSALPDSTAVTANTSYRWQYLPADPANYNSIGGSVVLYRSSGGSGGGSDSGGTVIGGGSSGSNGGSNTGSTTEASTNVRPNATLSGGRLSADLSEGDGQKLVNAAAKGSGSVAVTVAAPSGGAVDSVTASLPASTLSNLGYGTNASLTVNTPLGSVVLPNGSLSSVGGSSGTVEVSVSKGADQSVTVTVRKDGRGVGLSAGLKVGVPVGSAAARAGDGLVAVEVDAYGRQTVLPKSHLSGGQMNVLLDSSSATLRFVDNSKTFYDTGSHWAAGAVDFVSSHNLFQGTGATTFDPNAPMTRAMLVTVLHRLESEPSASRYSFPDVPSSSYYAEATAWAVDMGITQGDGGGFNGNGQISREMLATMLYRYVQQVNGGKGTLGSYSNMGDAGKVHSWADTAMRWAVGSGIINGDNGNLRPGDPASRAEVATMLVRFVDLITR